MQMTNMLFQLSARHFGQLVRCPPPTHCISAQLAEQFGDRVIPALLYKFPVKIGCNTQSHSGSPGGSWFIRKGP